MKILITGLTGFIGKNFYRYTKYRNNILAVSSKNSFDKNFLSDDINYLDCNLENIDNFAYEIKKFNPDCVLNFAWGGIPNYSQDVSNNNLKIILNFFNFLEKNTSIKKFINTGTCAEYFNPSGKVSENYIVEPYDHFSSAKITLSQELEKRCVKSNINYINLRLFYVFGINQRKNSLIPFLIDCYKKGTESKLSNPFSKLDYIYVEDVIDAIDSCVKNEIPSGSYNVGRGESISNYEIQKIISSKLNLKFNDDIYAPEKDMIDFFADINKLNSAVGWTPKFQIHEGVQKIIEETI
ncbi:MAG: NAD-dependent epimerase/dehydratase family protein [Dehalococcoidia bacterium]|tara:strand:- start:239 stop:1123 length:885 start_codon:yes stop_codon:yes gene_type:complete